jgi:hypothetical protein
MKKNSGTDPTLKEKGVNEYKGDGVKRWERDESDEKKSSGRGEEEGKRAWSGRSGRGVD